MDEDLDDFLDKLPAGLRQKAMKAAWGDDAPVQPSPPKETGKLVVKCILASIWSLIFGTLGFLFCITIILFPIGICFFTLAALPWAKIANKAIINSVERS